MIIKNNKILKVSAIVTVLSIGLLSGGYTLANKKITLVIKGMETEISTLKSNVEDVLAEQNIKYDKDDIISLPLDQKISDGDKIEVIEVAEKTIKENKEIPFEVNIVEDKNILKGETKVEVEGQPGNNELLYKITYHNGKQVEKKFIKEVVLTEPVDKVIKKGTKVELQVASSRGEITRSKSTSYSNSSSKCNSSSSNSNRKHISVVATAYTGNSITSTGINPKWGTIAVDPSVIPYGTKVYIPQFDKTFIAEDCGSAIKGNKIDIYMNDEEAVKNWGRKRIDIYIVG
ncbi:3D domain-containing protein [Romboutsia ilealis]|uniref:3D domain-containing protein n=1 Tax=Romboutsia ilealis TaxID=1115758 RepID=UPI0025B78631|nr:3D domain-containing protein [Romboutsia ilealis]